MSERAAGQGTQRRRRRRKMFGMLTTIFGMFLLVLAQAPTTASLLQQGSPQMVEPRASQGFEPNTTEHTTCLYGSHTYSHGQVVESLPRGCVQLICDDGNITKLYFDNPGNEGCCEFAGHVFAEGSNLHSHCVDLRCVMGQWVYGGSFKDCCAQSSIYDDPHLTTFDGHDYDFHGTCNYTLTQNDPSFHDPMMGVFADFTACPEAPSTASCLRYIVFRDNPHTIVTVDAYDVFELEVNGEAVTIPEDTTVTNLETSDGRHPVLAFRTGACLVLVGGSDIMLRVCRHRVDIFAHPSQLDSLYGLSGRFNGYTGDDFTDRLGHTYPLSVRPLAFPVSWKTNNQMEKRCDEACPEIFGCLGETAPDPCQARASGREVWDFYLDQCQQHLEQVVDEEEDLEKYIGSCATDLCLLRENGVDDVDERRWMEVLAVVVCEARNIVQARRGKLYDWDCSNPGTKNYTAVAWTSTTANYITTTTTTTITTTTIPSTITTLTTTTTTTPVPTTTTPTTIITTAPITLPTPTSATTTLPTYAPTSPSSFTASATHPTSSYTTSGTSSGLNCMCSSLDSSFYTTTSTEPTA